SRGRRRRRDARQACPRPRRDHGPRGHQQDRVAMPTTNSAKKPKGMPKKQLTHFEKRLLDERKRVLKELGRADEAFGATPQSADGDLSSYSFHMADHGTDAMESAKAFVFAMQTG